MIRLRRGINRGARPAVLGLLGLLSAAVMLAHSPMTITHHPGMGDEPVDHALSACLAVLEIASSLALFVVAWYPQLLRRRESRSRQWQGARPVSPISRPPAAFARAGPAELQVFRL